MFSHYEKLEKLNSEKERLEHTIESIKADLRQGLDATRSEQAVQLENYEVLMELLDATRSEQAVQLENYEVLMELLRISESELNEINTQIYQLENANY